VLNSPHALQFTCSTAQIGMNPAEPGVAKLLPDKSGVPS
jgi:hypothetical protein